MITIRNWVATIPEEDKHIGYLGEDGAEYRKFLITDWQGYRNWVFYLDMAFDLTSVTERDSRQVVDSQENVTETVEEKQVKTAKTGKKETYTKETVTVNAPAKTDVAYLSRKETEEGLVLTWKVLAQQTQLPGKLYANLRAEGPFGEVKKSARMVFEVDPAVVAEPAAPVPQSTFEVMKEDMNELCRIGYEQAAQTAENATSAASAAAEAATAAGQAEAHRKVCEEAASGAQQSVTEARHAAEDAEAAAATASSAAGQAQIASEAAANDAAVAQENRVIAANAAAKVLYLKDVAECYEYGKNLYDAQNAYIGYKLMFGELKESAEHITTDYIPHIQVGGACAYMVSAANAEENELYTVAMYDAALNFLSMRSTCKIGEVLTFDDTEEPYHQCAYMRFRFRRTLTDLQIEVGNTATAYEPYHPPMVKRACIPVDGKLDTASDNPVANAAVAGEFEQVSAEFLNVHGMMDDFNTDMGRALREIENLKKNGTGGGTGGSGEYNRISVRDYGAVGDGVADDRQAIIDAFTAAKSMLPCEVYFPAGTYGISNGITVDMAYGTGGLLVRGAGRDITQIKYLDSYDPDQLGNMWYAIRIWPVGMPNAKPAAADDYLHDISITGLSVFDPDPCAHAWHPSKGDPSKEETHGFDLQYIKRVSVTDCNLLYVGDEAIDICSCHDVIVMNNHIEGCPAAGTAGGAISIGDGCKGVVVSGNTVNGSAPDETLDDGTVLAKNNFGIAVESLHTPVVDVTITGNVVTNMQGHGINLGATNAGSGLTNIIIANNVIDHCRIGIDDEGTHPKQGIKICDNLITNTYNDTGGAGHAIRFTQGLIDVVVTGNTIKNIAGDRAIRAIEANSTQVYANNLLDGLAGGVFYVSGDITIRDCVIKNAGTVTRGTDGAIVCTTGVLSVANCTLINIENAKGIVGATSVENTDIELYKDGVLGSGDYIIDYSTTYRLKRVIGCRLRGRLWIKKDYAVVQGVIIESDNIGNNAITVAANGVSVTGCVIVTTTNNAISETSGHDCNIFANNIARKAIVTTGAHSIAVNNVDLDDMATA